MAMESSGQNPTRSPINQVASEDEIKTNVIIGGVIKEAGQTQYYISGIQKDKVHVPRKPELPVPQPVRNVPPCSCAIQQMVDKDISLSASKEDILWTKEEGLCPGKKYRPDEPGAYSCKMYPGDKFCRHNPFMKEIMKMEREKVERQEKEKEVKEKTESIEAVKKKTQVSRPDTMERKKDKFIPDPDYPTYDDPWDISRTAPSAKIKTDYEATLIPPAWATTSLPLKIQETQNEISFSKEHKKIKNDTLSKEINNKISLNSSKKIQKGNPKNKEMKDIKRGKKEPISLKKITINKRDTKLSNTISGSTATFKTEKKQQTKSSLPNNPTKQSNKINETIKYRFSTKKNKRKNINEAEEIDSRKREMARLKNMFKSIGILDNIQPVVLPEELAAISRYNPEEKTEEIVDSLADEEESRRTKKGPYGWRTESEQELPAKKTLAYLCEPDYPLETMTVRPGGRPCQCRENRNKKNAVSPRRSDEYIPEYDLLESPYNTCISEATDKTLKLIKKYSGPKSLVEKIWKKPKSCNCNNVVTKDRLNDQKKELEEIRKKLMESKSPEERWETALKDAALMDYSTQRDDNVPCWTSCKKIARSTKLVKKLA